MIDPERAQIGVIFDMDGLLVDSEPLWREAEIDVFGQLGVELTDAMMAETVGLRIEEIVAYWHKRCPWGEMNIDKVAAALSDAVATLARNRTIPKPGALNLIQQFRVRNVPMSVCSSSPMEVINATLDTLALQEQLHTIVSADDLIHGKPHPLPYLVTAERMGIAPSHLAVFEDSRTGCRSAFAAGCYVIAVPERDHKRFDSSICHEVAADLGHIDPETLLKTVYFRGNSALQQQ